MNEHLELELEFLSSLLFPLHFLRLLFLKLTTIIVYGASPFGDIHIMVESNHFSVKLDNLIDRDS